RRKLFRQYANFLKQQHVRLNRVQEIRESLPKCRPQSVHIPSRNPHQSPPQNSKTHPILKDGSNSIPLVLTHRNGFLSGRSDSPVDGNGPTSAVTEEVWLNAAGTLPGV